MSVSYTRTMDALLSLTADNYYKAGLVHDAVFKSNPTFAALHKKGVKTETTGGGKIQVNLMYGKNDTVKSYSRYEQLDTAPQDGIEPAFYPWSQYSGSVAIDGLSEFQNSGAPAIQKLLREKMTQLTMSFSEKMNADLWDRENLTIATALTGNGNKNIMSIPLYVQAVVATASTVGGIDQNTNAWWKNQMTDSDDTGSYALLLQELRTMYSKCSKGAGGPPDMVIADLTTYNIYEAAMDTKIRYTADEDASLGFENVKIKGAKMFWDEHVPDPKVGVNWDSGSVANGAAYFLNTKFLDLVVGKGKDFAPLGFQQPVDQDARVGLWTFYGQLVCSNRRKQGVLHDITPTIAA